MNKHTKIAIFIAPFLTIIGFAVTNMYEEQQAAENRIFSMGVQNQCDIKAKNCILVSEQFLLSISHRQGETLINSTHPLDTATLFIVNKNNNATSFPLGITDNSYYWRVKTNLAAVIDHPGAEQKLRIIANIKAGSYIREFTSTT